MRSAWILACLGIACRSPAGATAPHARAGDGEADPEVGELTPQSVGLPATPDAEPIPPRRPQPRVAPRDSAGPLPFYQYDECPPGRGGCVWRRRISEEVVETSLDCPDGVSYAGGHALRRVAIAEAGIEPASAAAGDQGLSPAQVRAGLVAHRDLLATCFRAAPATVHAEIQLVIDPAGRPLAIESNAHDAACVRDALGSLVFPRAPAATSAHARLDYIVEDPRTFATPLACP